MALLQTGFIGVFAVHYISTSLEEQIGQRALHVAKTIAAMPEVVQAVQQKDTAFLIPLSLNLAEQTDARFIVIGDRNGIRLAHPTAAKIGKSMHDDDNESNDRALIQGRGFISKAEGSLGMSMRGKAPIYDQVGEQIIGVVSVGYLLNRVQTIIDKYRMTIFLVIGIAFVVSVFIAILFARHFKKAIFGLEPEEIARMFEERNVTLQTVREGIISIDKSGHIATFNKTAIKTLDLDPAAPLSGRPIQEILPESEMLDVLATGEPQFDQEFHLKNHSLIVNRLPIRGENGEVTGVVSSFRRKDELDMVSRKLTRIQQYAETLRSQSHEYSNKLHTIAGLIQIGATDKALQVIGQETVDHQALIQLLLKAVPDPVLAGCLLGKYNRARELGLHLKIDPESHMTDLPDQLPREQLMSILGNVLDNALEATYRNHGAGGQVVLSMTDIGNDLIFDVEDQGAGIPEEQKQHIFEKGFTSKNEDGHGYGLHLVQSLITGLSGSICIEPADTGGSRFIIYIPKIPTPSVQAQQPSSGVQSA
ncbi:sensor histidine kinase [Motiliproteus sp. MSK22-1]|uniref:ATP-binding protein n=1 Tax=Motiliproteus sp. MSK22-1 TaxID=1897630 RepID=UPI001E3564D0|nr:sensor histidine kinase [Motiliproteus sp. MSK22-1]